MRLYHNGQCSKSCKAVELLKEEGREVELVEYTQNPISRAELDEILSLLKIDAFDLVRTKERLFQEKFADKPQKEYDWVGAMIQHPELMERPIFVNGNRAVIGRPPVKVLEI
ncbi:MAG: arsenate reductase [Bacteroidia bacterium]|nr:arsenate reductase [Bacteroidia bacterium]